MSKHVIVVASGETERRALPHLLYHLRARGIVVDGIRIPPRNKALDVSMAERLMKAAWYDNAGVSPDKFVLLLDIDRGIPDDVLTPFKEQLPGRMGNIRAAIQYAFAQEHLEAWYFADDTNLREYPGRALGSVDTSRPDGIGNPKAHLKNLLANRIYTARISEEIASRLSARTIAQRSPSFTGFLEAAMNGPVR